MLCQPVKIKHECQKMYIIFNSSTFTIIPNENNFSKSDKLIVSKKQVPVNCELLFHYTLEFENVNTIIFAWQLNVMSDKIDLPNITTLSTFSAIYFKNVYQNVTTVRPTKYFKKLTNNFNFICY